MKKLLLLVAAFLFLGIGAQAQEMRKGQLVGNARIDFAPTIAVSADYGMWEHLINKNDAISLGHFLCHKILKKQMIIVIIQKLSHHRPCPFK